MNYSIRKFQPRTDILKPFDCGDADLNDFLRESVSGTPNATRYEQELLAVTYVVEDNDSHSILAYFSLLHDKIDRQFVDVTIWNRLSREIPNAKRRSSYPALKIGRLAVCSEFQGFGLGKDIIRFIQGWYCHNRKAGCRYITVDALRSAESFYRKCNFKRLVNTNQEDTVLMFFDLKSIVKQQEL